MNQPFPRKNAVLWDESFLWALMAHQALSTCRIPFGFVTSEEVQRGALDGYDLLFVPGGWASDKARALGKTGRDKIRQFVRDGGAYVGFCGGAGLALDVPGGLSLVPVKRVPTRDRMPNFSGKIRMVPADRRHLLWKGLPESVAFYAWWPGQFALDPEGGVEVVARYGEPGHDFFVADLFCRDVESSGRGWESWEESYGIHMNPEKLLGEPAILEGEYGEGKALLSYLHLDTPGDSHGLLALRNLFDGLETGKPRNVGESDARTDAVRKVRIDSTMVEIMDRIDRGAKDLISFGQRNYLWYWRNSYLLQWRRGIRGMEYGTMQRICRELLTRFNQLRNSGTALAFAGEGDLVQDLADLQARAEHFFESAKRLLIRERYAMNNGTGRGGRDRDPEIEELRALLFSTSKRLGGLFKELLDQLDGLLLMALRSDQPAIPLE